MSTESATPTAAIPTWPALQQASSEAGIDPVNWLVSATALLGGIASPEWGFLIGPAVDRRINPNLLIPVSALVANEHVESMLSPLRRLQDRLRRRSSDLRSEEIEQVIHGHGTKGAGAKLHHLPQSASRSLRNTAWALGISPSGPTQPKESQADHEADVRNRTLQLREHALRHPDFLVENLDLARLPNALMPLHLGRALLAGRLSPLLRPTPGKLPRIDLLALLDGVDVAAPQTPGLSPLCNTSNVTASAILTADTDDLLSLRDKHPNLLSHFAILAPSCPVLGGDILEVPSSGDTPLLSGLLLAFNHLIGGRRAGVCVVREFKCPEKSKKFACLRLQFLRRLEEQGSQVYGLASLPSALAWTIASLHSGADVDDLMLHIALPYSEALLKGHLESLSKLEKTGSKAPSNGLAHRIVRRISDRGPMRERDLRRTFSDQRVETHRPVVDHLLASEVLALGERDQLALGPTSDAFLRSAESCPQS